LNALKDKFAQDKLSAKLIKMPDFEKSDDFAEFLMLY
jgi:hypothetical protein